MHEDPAHMIGTSPMHWRQIVVVGLCISLNALDGVDILASSFAAPGIAQEWGVDRAVLGIVLAMELLGMAVGSVLIGNLADRVGRRPIILSCLVVMAAGMFLSAASATIPFLSFTRLLTGFGIGGVISATSAMTAEFSNDRRRNLNVTLNIAGYSFGAVLGGFLISLLLEGQGNWRDVFLFGATLTTMLLPLVWLFMPESPESLLARRPSRALDRLNRILVSFGLEALASLPEATISPKQSISALFSRRLGGATIVLTIAYFAQVMLFYYVQKWVPKIIVDMGYEPSQASRVLVIANIGNLISAVLMGFAAQRIRVRPLVAAAMVAGFVAMGLFGLGGHSLSKLTVAVTLAAFLINAGIVGMYPILAQTFPSHLRATGIGFVIGIGRGGSAIGPVIAGTLFSAGANLLVVSLVMGAGGLLAGAMLLVLPRFLNEGAPA